MRRPPSPAARQARREVVNFRTVPAPVGGWNARDSKAAMRPEDALELENWYPRELDVVIRGGEADHVTGFAARPRTLALHTPPTGSNKMFAVTDAGIFDATSAGAVGASVLARTEGYHQWTQMGVSGGHFLMLFNGVDKPAYFDGTTWTAVDGASTPAITGLTTTTIVSGHVFKRRLFFIQGAKLSFWYLPVDVVGGAAVEFPLGPVAQKGGFLMAMGAWTFDSGSGPDDFAVFVTSEGEVIVYQGTDPGSASAWALVGVYQLGAKPLGRKCLIKYGGDLVLITEFGVLPLGDLIRTKSVDFKLALTDRISPAFVAQARDSGGIEGWEGLIYPGQNAFIFNVPRVADTTFDQYVMNTITKRWCKFTGWNASAWVLFNKEVYFADSTRVAKAWTGRSDDGNQIIAQAQSAFNYFNNRKEEKEWEIVRPILETDGPLTFSLGLAIDFENPPQLATAIYSVVEGARWDVDLWDVGMWGSGLSIQKEPQTPGAEMGLCASTILRVATAALEVHWIATDYLFKTGDVRV